MKWSPKLARSLTPPIRLEWTSICQHLIAYQMPKRSTAGESSASALTVLVPLPFHFENFNKNHNFSQLHRHCRSFVTIAYTNRHFGTLLLAFVFMAPSIALSKYLHHFPAPTYMVLFALYNIISALHFGGTVAYLLSSFSYIFRSFRALSGRCSFVTVSVSSLSSPSLPAPALFPRLPSASVFSGALNRQFIKYSGVKWS